MYMQDFTGKISYRIGTLCAPSVPDKAIGRVYDAEILLYEFNFTIAQYFLRSFSTIHRQSLPEHHTPIKNCFVYRSCIYLFHIGFDVYGIASQIYATTYLLLFYDPRLSLKKKLYYLEYLSGNIQEQLSWKSIFTKLKRKVSEFEFTVKSLYAGTLVRCWITATSISPCRSSSALVATLLFFIATLTIATRCYAFSQVARAPPDQLKPLSKNLSPIYNSKIHSSNIVLSRLFPSGHVQSDISIIFSNSKKLLFNQNSKTNYRTKREIYSGRAKYISTANSISNRFKKLSEPTEIKTRTNFARNFDERVHALNLYGLFVNNRSGGESAVDSRVNNTRRNFDYHQNTSFDEDNRKKRIYPTATYQPMPPLHGHSNDSLNKWGVAGIIVSAVVLTVALGLITCVLSHYRTGTAPEGGGTASDPHNAAPTPTSAPMLSVVSAGATAGVGGMDRLRGGRAAARELATTRDRQVRLHALHTDIAINLPPSIAMPDGEEHPYTNSRLHLRDAEQEAEIYQKCIRPPPNRTVLESEPPPPYRSSSAGLLGSSSSSSCSSSSDWSGGNAPLVVRCHSMSSTSKRPEAGSSGQKTDFIQRTVKIFTGKKTPQPPAPTLPVVVVPTRRRTSDQQNAPTNRPKPGV